LKVTEEDILKLKRISNNVRKSIVEEVYSAQSGHPGGALSCADILTVLYFNQMNIDPEKKDDLDRDRLVLSKGHASAALYAVLAERGYFSTDDMNISGSEKLFIDHRNVSIATEITAGFMQGTSTNKSVCNELQPSISAASSRSRGIL